MPTVTALSPAAVSGNIPGVGHQIFFTMVFSNLPQAGGLLDLSAYFDTMVLGGRAIKDTVNDGGYHLSLVSGASTASYLIQAYGMPTAATSGALVLLSDADDLSAINGQTWTAWGY